MHHKWSQSGVYKCAYDEIVSNNDDLYISDDVSINLFIDSTLIINKSGSEGIGYGGETKKKKFTKLTVVCNENTQNVAVYANKVNTKVISTKTINTKTKKVKNDLDIIEINKHINELIFDQCDHDLFNMKSNNVKPLDVKINTKPLYVKINTKSLDVKINTKPLDVKINTKPLDVKINVKPLNVKQPNVKPPIVKALNVKPFNVKPFNVKPLDVKINKKSLDVEINAKPFNAELINVKTLNKPNKDTIKIVKTLEHDVKGVKPIIKLIGKKNKPIKLIGDKGYLISKDDRKELKSMNVDMIAPKRKNQKDRNTDDELNHLRTRYKVENSIAKIKVFNRIHVRRDKLLCTYMGFVYLAFIRISQK
jgi:hypothetical protein